MSLARRSFMGAAGALAAMVLVPQSAQAGTVVASSGPSAAQYPVGAQVGDTQRIALRAGDSITVLQGGQTRVLRGPGTFILAQRTGRTENRALSALTTRRSANRARTGAVRGEGEEVTNPNMWYVDVARAGTICLANADPIQLWRADSAMAASYSVGRTSAPRDSVRVSFPEREMLGIWDGALQVREGETYAIAPSAGGNAVEVSFVFLQDVPEDGEALALALIENGCTVQLEQMANALHQN